MHFLNPQLGWWLLGAFVAVAVMRTALRRRFAAATTVRWIDRSSRASIVRRLPFLTLLAALVLTGLALMDPVLPFSESQIQSRGLDIVVVLDLSSSMQEEMERARPSQLMQSAAAAGSREAAATLRRPPGKTRLEAVKGAIRNFVSRRRDDRLGLVVFSDNAYVISPLTFDHEYLMRYIDLVDDQILRGEGMTAIGDGLALANFLLSRQAIAGAHRNPVIVLFTDGENNRGRDPLEVLREVDEAGVRVHMVGVDLEDEVRRKPEVQRLVQTIRARGGRYFDATSIRDLDAASRAIDTIEKGLLTSKTYIRDQPVTEWFAVPALILFGVTIALTAFPYFVDLT